MNQTDVKPWERKTTIRGMDQDLHLESVIAAKRAGISWGEWINQAIKAKLDRLAKTTRTKIKNNP